MSGYTPCACRDCMDITVSSDTSKPELCSECKEAGCEDYAERDAGVADAWRWECQREDAPEPEYPTYGQRDDAYEGA